MTDVQRSDYKVELDIVGGIMDYEAGTLSPESTLRLFGALIGSGKINGLQGSYGRMARDLMGAGFIDQTGKVDWDRFEQAQEEAY